MHGTAVSSQSNSQHFPILGNESLENSNSSIDRSQSKIEPNLAPRNVPTLQDLSGKSIAKVIWSKKLEKCDYNGQQVVQLDNATYLPGKVYEKYVEPYLNAINLLNSIREYDCTKFLAHINEYLRNHKSCFIITDDGKKNLLQEISDFKLTGTSKQNHQLDALKEKLENFSDFFDAQKECQREENQSLNIRGASRNSQI